MSIKVMSAVWDRSRHKGAPLLLLLAIADHAHDDGGGAYPKVASLAQKIRMSERQVQRILVQLEQSGELQIEWGAGPHGTHRYTVNLVALWGDKMTPDKMSPRQNVGVTNPAARGDKPRVRGDMAMSPEPSVEPSTEPSESDKSNNDSTSVTMLMAASVGETDPVHAAFVNIGGTSSATFVRRVHDLTRRFNKTNVVREAQYLAQHKANINVDLRDEGAFFAQLESRLAPTVWHSVNRRS